MAKSELPCTKAWLLRVVTVRTSQPMNACRKCYKLCFWGTGLANLGCAILTLPPYAVSAVGSFHRYLMLPNAERPSSKKSTCERLVLTCWTDPTSVVVTISRHSEIRKSSFVGMLSNYLELGRPAISNFLNGLAWVSYLHDK